MTYSEPELEFTFANQYATSNNTNIAYIYILSRTIFELLSSTGQIIASDKWVPLVNALVLCNLCELT